MIKDTISGYFALYGEVVRSAIDDYAKYHKDRHQISGIFREWYQSAEWFLFDDDGLARIIMVLGLPLNIDSVRNEARDAEQVSRKSREEIQDMASMDKDQLNLSISQIGC